MNTCPLHALGTLFAAPLLSHYSNKRVLVTSLFLNCALATAFAPAPNSDLLLTLRFFIGVCCVEFASTQTGQTLVNPPHTCAFACSCRKRLW